MYKLYWVEVNIKTEDWFVVAKSKLAAEEYLASEEGFDDDMVQAHLVCEIKAELVKKYLIDCPTYPPMDLLTDLNCKIHSYEVPRIVNYEGKIFVEGNLSALIATDIIGKKEGVYIIRNGVTNEYKIGITTNIKKRLQQFSTGNANTVRLLYFIHTNLYKSLEKQLHDAFKSNRIKGEWFRFDNEDIETIKELLILLKARDEYKVYDIDGAHKQLNYKIR